MKFVLEVCLIVAGMTGIVLAQDPTKPVLQKGIPVEMPVASEAVAIPAADEISSTLVTVTAEGNLFLGLKPVTVDALAYVAATTVYVKADAKVPFQQVLTLLDALHGHSVVLLAAPTVKTENGKFSPPYGVRVAVGSAD